MADHIDKALAEYLIALGDDELILGHRVSEWCGHAPILEEDIAFANIALDEIGHSRLWYQVASELLGKDPSKYPDELVFLRSAEDFRCMQIVELPNGDWAFSIMRQYLFDSYEPIRLAAVLESVPHDSVYEVANKIQTEEIYHLRHSEAWIKRLGQGTKESNSRLQNALNSLWPFRVQFECEIPGETVLTNEGYFFRSLDEFELWEKGVKKLLEDAGLSIPQERRKKRISRETHSKYFTPLITDMQEVARTETGVRW